MTVKTAGTTAAAILLLGAMTLPALAANQPGQTEPTTPDEPDLVEFSADISSSAESVDIIYANGETFEMTPYTIEEYETEVEAFRAAKDQMIADGEITEQDYAEVLAGMEEILAQLKAGEDIVVYKPVEITGVDENGDPFTSSFNIITDGACEVLEGEMAPTESGNSIFVYGEASSIQVEENLVS